MTQATIRLYRPSNGIEGATFMDAWCSKCAKDLPMSQGKDYDECEPHETCPIIAATMVYNVDSPKYPKEWQYDSNGYAICTAFSSMPVTQKCEHTMELPL